MLTPKLQGDVCRVATYAPFRSTSNLIRQLLGVSVSEATVRRLTERIGAAAVGALETERLWLEGEAPTPPQGPEKLLMSTDGAMVPLVGGEWAEVKTVAVGRVGAAVPDKKNGYRIPCTELSYFSRLLAIDEFILAAYPEMFRRGVETAREVGAPNDGADWCQTFVQFHRPDARRILDFPHAGQRIAEVAKLCFGEGEATRKWSSDELSALKREGPDAVIGKLEDLAAKHPGDAKVRENLEYLRKRRDQMDYPGHRDAGWPIGSGCVESANKLVVEARLKGPGMHWSRDNVNPMLALRNGECSGRWDQVWAQASHELRRRRRPRQLPQEKPATEARTPQHKEETKVQAEPVRKLCQAAMGHPWRQFNPGWLARD